MSIERVSVNGRTWWVRRDRRRRIVGMAATAESVRSLDVAVVHKRLITVRH